MPHVFVRQFYPNDTVPSATDVNTIVANTNESMPGKATAAKQHFRASGDKTIETVTGTTGSIELLSGDGSLNVLGWSDIVAGQRKLLAGLDIVAKDMLYGRGVDDAGRIPFPSSPDGMVMTVVSGLPVWKLFPATYETFNSNGDVGTGADQLAQGDHTH